MHTYFLRSSFIANKRTMTTSQQPTHGDSRQQQTPQDDVDVGGPSEEVRPILKVLDPFLYYSNDRVRMKELHFEDVEEEDSSDDASSTSLSNQEQSTSSCERKTRITFELHPSLLLEDLMDDLSNDDSHDDLDAILDASSNSGGDDVFINSLRQIMLGEY